jgi:penicillin-binding protein 1A
MHITALLKRWQTLSMPLKALVAIILPSLMLVIFCLISLPNVTELNHVRMQVPLKIFTSDHKLIATFGEKQRFPVTINEIPKAMQQAFIAAEDRRFYRHHGVDFFGLMRAAGALVVKRGHITQGASTITMQVARNFYLSRNKTFARKFNEILLALKIERTINKDKILELYLNKIYLGERSYGVAAAGQIYYGKPLAALDLAQIAMLAGLPKAPSANNPINNPKRALKRRDYVLKRMLTLGFISDKDYDQAHRQVITASYHGPNIEVKAPYVAEMARSAMIKSQGESAYTGGFSVYTTLNSNIQTHARQALQRGLIAYSKRHGFTGTIGHINEPETWPTLAKKIPSVSGFHKALIKEVNDHEAQAILQDNTTQVSIPWTQMKWARKRLSNGYTGKEPANPQAVLSPGDIVYIQKHGKTWQLTQTPKAQGALVSLDANNGKILGLSGGFNYSLSAYNRVTQAKRQSGSAFKPFVYAAALANDFTLASIINDAPIVIDDTSSTTAWRPHNSTEKFHGPTRLREGLIKSRNLVSIRLLQALGIETATKFLTRFAFAPEDLPQSLSLALGSGTQTPLEITRGYAAFANGGFLVQPSFIEKIIDANGQIWYQQQTLEACESCKHQAPRIMDQSLAYLINDTLQGVIKHGTGRQALKLGRYDLAGKTGTTNNKQDAWFAGFNQDIVTTVWLGYDNPKSLHEYGAQAALPIWIDFMGHALKNKPQHTLKRPTNIVTIRIDPRTGKPAQRHSKNSIFEIFAQPPPA